MLAKIFPYFNYEISPKTFGMDLIKLMFNMILEIQEEKINQNILLFDIFDTNNLFLLIFHSFIHLHTSGSEPS